MIASRILAVLVCVTLAFLAGCGNKVTPWSVRTNMSPELMTMNKTSGQQMNNFARAFDTNLRYGQDDLYRVMMWDQPNDMGGAAMPPSDR